jgi:hypothetical protein
MLCDVRSAVQQAQLLPTQPLAVGVAAAGGPQDAFEFGVVVRVPAACRQVGWAGWYSCEAEWFVLRERLAFEATPKQTGAGPAAQPLTANV